MSICEHIVVYVSVYRLGELGGFMKWNNVDGVHHTNQKVEPWEHLVNNRYLGDDLPHKILT